MTDRDDLDLSLGVRLGQASWITCHVYPDHAPILAVYDRPLHLSIAPRDVADVRPEDVRTARELVAAASKYAAECERLCPDADPPPSGDA